MRLHKLVFSVMALFLTLVLGTACQRDPPKTDDEAETNSSPPSSPARGERGDWCAGHGLPESMCTKCNPGLTEGFKEKGDWCEEHQLPESACPVCNPMLPPQTEPTRADTRTTDPSDWCAGHDLPESMCTKCNPELTEGFKASGDWCEGHGFPESACPTCNPMPPPTRHAEPPSDWCAGHALPESMCTKCNPGLVEAFKKKGDWCAGHGFPESACPVCSPMTPPPTPRSVSEAEPSPDWCMGHGLPESMCAKCNPELIEGFKEKGDWCVEHGLPESACPVCNPMTPPPGASSFDGQRIQFKNAQHEAIVGIKTDAAQRTPSTHVIETVGRVAYNHDRTADVRSLVPGLVRKVHVKLGVSVEQDAPLFTLESADVNREQGGLSGARQRVSTAQSDLKRQRQLRKLGANSVRQLEKAERELAAARSALTALQRSLGTAGAEGAAGEVVLRAPLAGVIVRRPGVLGTLATSETSLATITDTSTMWALLDAPEQDTAAMQPGQSVEVRVDGLDRERFEGVIDWIMPEVNPRTRTVEIRVALDNARGLLRAHQFIHARVKVGAPEDALTVRTEAIQRIGEESVVFVRVSSGVYEARSVIVGRQNADRVTVEGSLREGEPVVTTGAFVLKTELSPQNIGAGCCEAGGSTEGK